MIFIFTYQIFMSLIFDFLPETLSFQILMNVISLTIILSLIIPLIVFHFGIEIIKTSIIKPLTLKCHECKLELMNLESCKFYYPDKIICSSCYQKEKKHDEELKKIHESVFIGAVTYAHLPQKNDDNIKPLSPFNEINTIHNVEIVKVSSAMKAFGGNFIQALSELIIVADSINLEKIKTTFKEEWEKYLKLGIENLD